MYATWWFQRTLHSLTSLGLVAYFFFHSSSLQSHFGVQPPTRSIGATWFASGQIRHYPDKAEIHQLDVEYS